MQQYKLNVFKMIRNDVLKEIKDKFIDRSMTVLRVKKRLRLWVSMGYLNMIIEKLRENWLKRKERFVRKVAQ